jgi:hypothetical protein
MNRRDLENGTEENREVAELLAALPRVEAPANFEFGVKARIASGEQKGGSALFTFLKVAVPLSLILAVGGFAIFYGTTSDDDTLIANTAVPLNYAPDPAPVTNGDQTARNETGPRTLEPQVKEPVDVGTEVAVESQQETPLRRTPRTRGVPVTKDEQIFTKDVSVGPPKRIFTPPGIPASDGGEISVREVLEMLGMKVDLVSGRWQVLSTSANSIAEKSGVLASDVVESINEQAIRGKEKLKGKLEAKMLTVGRDGKSIKLDLKR